jgi:23S rRNA (pseudouridine1915-N3)-methyltransferase
MRLCVLTIGRLKDGPERDLCERYATRALQSGRALGFSGPDIIELPESKARRPEDRKTEEAAALVARITQGYVLVLDERGKSTDSEAFAAELATARDRGTASCTLVIGGADGLDASVRGLATRVVSFGALTIPHQLVRVLVLEQLYRAMTIMGSHPYHRV